MQDGQASVRRSHKFGCVDLGYTRSFVYRVKDMDFVSFMRAGEGRFCVSRVREDEGREFG